MMRGRLSICTSAEYLTVERLVDPQRIALFLMGDGCCGDACDATPFGVTPWWRKLTGLRRGSLRGLVCG
jgi:hypothetical protein